MLRNCLIIIDFVLNNSNQSTQSKAHINQWNVKNETFPVELATIQEIIRVNLLGYWTSKYDGLNPVSPLSRMDFISASIFSILDSIQYILTLTMTRHVVESFSEVGLLLERRKQNWWEVRTRSLHSKMNTAQQNNTWAQCNAIICNIFHYIPL